MLNAQMLHQAFNTTQPLYVPKVAWKDLSEVAQAKYEGMAYCLNRDMCKGLATWTELQNMPSYAERNIKRFQKQVEEIGV